MFTNLDISGIIISNMRAASALMIEGVPLYGINYREATAVKPETDAMPEWDNFRRAMGGFAGDVLLSNTSVNDKPILADVYPQEVVAARRAARG